MKQQNNKNESACVSNGISAIGCSLNITIGKRKLAMAWRSSAQQR